MFCLPLKGNLVLLYSSSMLTSPLLRHVYCVSVLRGTQFYVSHTPLLSPTLCELMNNPTRLLSGKRKTWWKHFSESTTPSPGYTPIFAIFSRGRSFYDITVNLYGITAIYWTLFSIFEACNALPIDRTLLPAVLLGRISVILRAY